MKGWVGKEGEWEGGRGISHNCAIVFHTILNCLDVDEHRTFGGRGGGSWVDEG